MTAVRTFNIIILALLVGCVDCERVSRSSGVAALLLSHGDHIEECLPGEETSYLYDDGQVCAWRSTKSDVAYVEADASAKMQQLADAITACLSLGSCKPVLFWKGIDCASSEAQTLELCSLPLCPPITVSKIRTSVVNVDVRRGGCVFVNGRRISSVNELSSCLRKIRQANPSPEVVIRVDKRSQVSSLRQIVNSCTANGIWDVFFVGQNASGQCTVCPVNVPCPNAE